MFQRKITLDERNQIAANRGRYFAEGLCMFHVIDVNEAQSKSGNDMLVIDMQVWDNRGKEGTLKEYIVDHPDLHWKLWDFLDAIELQDMYLEGGTFDANRIRGKAGKFTLRYKKDKNGEEQRNITFIVPMPGQSALTAKRVESMEFNDDIPF